MIDLTLKYLNILLLPFLYAETHYRFKYFFSYLKKNEAEIIADIPSRLRIGDPLPVLLVIKDADKYPAEILKIELTGQDIQTKSVVINRSITSSYADIITRFDSSDFSPGAHYLTIKVYYKTQGRQKICFSDNHRGTSHAPLLITMAADELPRFNHCIYGETHCHTNFTSDQVEFGASLEATKTMAKALGLDFFCATDHSYDMDDFEDNYLENDPDLKKWHTFRRAVQDSNDTENDIMIIPGEEVTIRNTTNKNVHLLVYNSEKFFYGSGDSGEKWFRTRSELSFENLVPQIKDQVLLFAAHPAEIPPFLQRVFINRGIWKDQDCRQPGLQGLQLFNGGEEIYNAYAMDLWIRQLLNGQRLVGIAGNDAHGNFSRYRQVAFPFITMRENTYHLFGKWRTGVYLDSSKKDIAVILRQIKAGSCFMTNGPALDMQVEAGGKWRPMGAVCSKPSRIRISILSTAEFSWLKEVHILVGNTSTQAESILYTKTIKENTYHFATEVLLADQPLAGGYLRTEAITQENFKAYSNPVWIE
jgi:hypothetical protein